jgi:hypothetical protein
MCPELITSKLSFHRASHLTTFFTNCIFGNFITAIKVQSNVGRTLKTIQNQVNFFSKRIGVYCLP